MIFIAYDYDGYPISIVNARNKELANAYWQGADIVACSSKCLEEDFESIDKHITGVYPILKTQEKNITSFGDHHGKKYIIVSK
jgi:hypothetical protein